MDFRNSQTASVSITVHPVPHPAPDPAASAAVLRGWRIQPIAPLALNDAVPTRPIQEGCLDNRDKLRVRTDMYIYIFCASRRGVSVS